MALQQINWLQIDTATVPSGSVIDLGAVSGALHAVYADNLFISGQTLQQYIENSGTAQLNLYSASLKAAIETTGSNLTVKGNLLVKGTTTAVNSTTVSIGDNVIELNGSEAAYGGLLIKDITSPNTISGSLLWDSANDRWIGGPLGSEDTIILQEDLTNFSSSVTNLINDIGLFRETGSFYATTNDLQVTGSMRIKGDLIVDGTTTLRQPNDPNLDTLIVSGAMNIVKNEINAQLVRAQLKIENLGALSDRAQISVLDCGDGFF
jgi:cytoskeletal protein CcmA (bactofilin family)